MTTIILLVKKSSKQNGFGQLQSFTSFETNAAQKLRAKVNEARRAWSNWRPEFQFRIVDVDDYMRDPRRFDRPWMDDTDWQPQQAEKSNVQ